MTIADTVRQSAVEAKKYALRQSKDGVIVSFVLHPADMNDVVTLAPIGQRGMLVFVPIGEDEQPNAVQGGGTSPVSNPPQAEPKAEDRSAASERGRQAYLDKSEGEKAVVRAAILCDDLRFCQFLGERLGGQTTAADAHGAASDLRQLLGIQSRREIADDPVIYQRFLDLEFQFSQYIGREPTL